MITYVNVYSTTELKSEDDVLHDIAEKDLDHEYLYTIKVDGDDLEVMKFDKESLDLPGETAELRSDFYNKTNRGC